MVKHLNTRVRQKLAVNIYVWPTQYVFQYERVDYRNPNTVKFVLGYFLCMGGLVGGWVGEAA